MSYLQNPSENTLQLSSKFNNVFWPFLWGPVYSSYRKTQNRPGQVWQSSDPLFIFNEGALSEVCSTEVTIQVLLMPQLKGICFIEPRWWVNCLVSLAYGLCSERGALVITKKVILYKRNNNFAVLLCSLFAQQYLQKINFVSKRHNSLTAIRCMCFLSHRGKGGVLNFQ